MLSTVKGPPAARGRTWWNSRNRVAPQSRPSRATKAHRPPSRCHTVRFTAARLTSSVPRNAEGGGDGRTTGTAVVVLSLAWGVASVGRLMPDAPPSARRDRGREVAAHFRRFNCSRRTVSDLGHVAPGNGMAEEVLRFAKLLSRFCPGRESDLVALRGERPN